VSVIDEHEARLLKLETQVEELSETILAMLVDDEEEEMDIIEAQHQKFRAKVRSVRDA